MKISADDAHPVFVEVKRVKETLRQYCLMADAVPVSLDDIEYAISQEYGAVIEKKLLPFKSDLVRGLIRIWAPQGAEKLRVQTVIDADLNRAQTRFVQTKELCHIILHHADNCTQDPTDIIEYFVQDNLVVTNGGPDPVDVKNEGLADLAAYELLFPHELRAAAKARIDSGEDTIFGTADWLELPEHVVETVLGKYLPFAEYVWSNVNA